LRCLKSESEDILIMERETPKIGMGRLLG